MNDFLRLLSASLIFLTFNSRAQNLVSNPSFETANKMPQNGGNSINRSKDWMAPIASSDYYMKGAGRKVGTPKNIFGKQKPHSGNAYAGICTRTKFLEYLETKLIDTLKNDQEYLIEFYISRAERSLGSVKEFGALFTNKKIWGLTGKGISEKPQIIFTNKKGYKNKKEWVKLSAVYKAQGNETVLILGHFNYNPSDGKRKMYSHYYIDDVSVVPIENKNDTVILTNEKEKIEEAFSPKLGEARTLKNIFFETNKSELLPKSFSELDKLAQFLIENPNTLIQISGHTDNSGSEKHNKMLSESRAKSVADYLKSKGVIELRINYVGQGSSNPVASNDTDEGKQRNRRVEFTINQK